MINYIKCFESLFISYRLFVYMDNYLSKHKNTVTEQKKKRTRKKANIIATWSEKKATVK